MSPGQGLQRLHTSGRPRVTAHLACCSRLLLCTPLTAGDGAPGRADGRRHGGRLCGRGVSAGHHDDAQASTGACKRMTFCMTCACVFCRRRLQAQVMQKVMHKVMPAGWPAVAAMARRPCIEGRRRHWRLPVPHAMRAAALKLCRPADPEPLKRLKMEMRVALKDEDYAAAARIRWAIGCSMGRSARPLSYFAKLEPWSCLGSLACLRQHQPDSASPGPGPLLTSLTTLPTGLPGCCHRRDHPWMRLHLSCLKARQRGDEDEAERCERQLQAAISRHELEEERQQAQRQREAGGGGGGGGWGGGGGGPGLPFY